MSTSRQRPELVQERGTGLDLTSGQPVSEDAPVTKTMNRVEPQSALITAAIARRSFGTLATTSANNRPHVAAVLYKVVDGVLYVHTFRTSKKARNIAQNPHVFMCIPVRRIPVGPPSTIQFQATAEILAMDDPHMVSILQSGQLKKIAGHGALEEAEGCFLRIMPAKKMNTYGLGLPLRQLIQDPLHAGGSVLMS